jgi:hypothetical protein
VDWLNFRISYNALRPLAIALDNNLCIAYLRLDRFKIDLSPSMAEEAPITARLNSTRS